VHGRPADRSPPAPASRHAPGQVEPCRLNHRPDLSGDRADFLRPFDRARHLHAQTGRSAHMRYIGTARAFRATRPGVTPMRSPLLLFATSSLIPVAAPADCIDDAALHHQVNPYVLRAIGWQESRLNPEALHRNENGTTDLGAFQINSIHLPTLH